MKHSIMRRSAALLLILCIAMTAFASCNSFSDTEYAIVSENNISADGFIYDKYENSTVRITGIENSTKILVIPEQIDGMQVVEISDSAFADNDTLIYLELPGTPIKLGRGFCSGCVALTGVNLAGSVTSLPDNSFEGCGNVSFIKGAENVTEIGSQAFAGCSSLADFNMPTDLVSIGAEAFRGCSSLASVVLPETLTSVGESAFWACENLVSVTWNGSANIPQYCFLYCIRLTDVTLGGAAEIIGEEAFRSCFALYSITFGKNIKEIGNYAFHACDQLTEIRFTDKKNETVIGEGNEALGLSN